MHAEVDLENVVVLENDFFGTGIGSPMSGTIVHSQPSGESLAGLESISSLNARMTD
jgi:hypothetical protein